MSTEIKTQKNKKSQLNLNFPWWHFESLEPAKMNVTNHRDWLPFQSLAYEPDLPIKSKLLIITSASTAELPHVTWLDALTSRQKELTLG